MSHFVLDARTATPHFPGIGRYVTNLACALISLLTPEERLTVLYDPAHLPALPLTAQVQLVPVPVTPFTLAQQAALPRLLRSLRANLYHSAYYLMPYRPGVPTVLTVYDLIPLLFPAHSTLRARLLFRWTTRLALRAARRVITISEATRRDLLARFRLPAERVTAIPLAADPALAPQPPAAIAALRARYALPEQFLLYLGSNKPHKNLVRLVEALAKAKGEWQMANSEWRMAKGEGRGEKGEGRKKGEGPGGKGEVGMTLVVAGAWDARYPEARQRAEALGLGEAVRWLGPVPEADLPALYSAATAFVFPSLYEGFGLPVLEAMACGTPVVCANTSSLPEVAGEAAVYFDPTNVNQVAEALGQVWVDAGLRAALRERGLLRAQAFSWHRTAEQTRQVYLAVQEEAGTL